jgi:exosortase A-associated hydrolase 1
MKVEEIPLIIPCADVGQIGILHKPAQAKKTGIVVVVAGGPQYRVGCARQIILWSRRLASEGYPVLRFDYRGFGDSAGEFLGFENVNADIETAIDQLILLMPELQQIVLWAECNAASAAMMYAWRDRRVSALIMQNPWVRDEVTEARTYIKHYYLMRFMQKSFWLKLLKLQINPVHSILSLLGFWRTSRQITPFNKPSALAEFDSLPTYQDKMREGLNRFTGDILLFMSGYSFIGKEFDGLVEISTAWQQILADKALTRIDAPAADHTFSRSQDREALINQAVQWLNQR